MLVHRAMVMSLKSGERAEEAHEAVFKYDVKPRLPAIEAPVLLLYTKSDGFQDRLEYLTPLIRRHKLEYIPGGSNVLMENPDVFANAVAAFIASPGI
jgi:pimeloyl-ACP methyl ester carboxylesterase